MSTKIQPDICLGAKIFLFFFLGVNELVCLAFQTSVTYYRRGQVARDHGCQGCRRVHVACNQMCRRQRVEDKIDNVSEGMSNNTHEKREKKKMEEKPEEIR